MSSQEKFYYLKLISSRTGERWFVGEDKGEMILSSQFVGATKMFPTYQDAQKYMRNNKLERNGISAHIRDNDDLIKEASMPNSGITNIKPVDAHQEVFVLVDPVGQRCFYDTEKGEYYFKDSNIGAIAFFSQEQIAEFFTKVKFAFEVKAVKLDTKKNK